MLVVAITVLGILVGWWAIFGPDLRLVLLSQFMARKVWLSIWAAILLVVALASPFIMDQVAHHWPSIGARPMFLAALENCVLVFWVLVGMSTVLDGRWSARRIQLTTPALLGLIRENKASAAAAVVARITGGVRVPGVMRQSADASTKIVDGDKEAATPARSKGTALTNAQMAYEDLLKICLKHDSFAEALVREQTETAAMIIKAPTTLARWEAGPLLRMALTRSPHVLVTEIASCPSPASYEPEHFIPRECVLLHALADDPRVAERVGAWKSIGDVVVDELRARSAGLSDHGVDVLSPNMNHEGFMKSPIDAGIRFLHILAARAVYEQLGDEIDVYYYKEFTKYILELLPDPRPDEPVSDQTRYHRYLWEMLASLQDLVLLTAPKLAGRKEHSDDSSTGYPVTDMQKRCMMTHAWCVAEIVRSDNAPHQLKMDRVASAVEFYGTLATGMPNAYIKLPEHAAWYLGELRKAFMQDFHRFKALANDQGSDVKHYALSCLNEAVDAGDGIEEGGAEH